MCIRDSYSTDIPINPTTFIDLLHRSTLAERRPVDDAETIAGMLANADVTVTAWDGDLLVEMCIRDRD